MTTVTVSPKYQIVIPARTRKEFPIDPGEKLQILTTMTGSSCCRSKR